MYSIISPVFSGSAVSYYMLELTPLCWGLYAIKLSNSDDGTDKMGDANENMDFWQNLSVDKVNGFHLVTMTMFPVSAKIMWQ